MRSKKHSFGETMQMIMDAKGMEPVDVWRDTPGVNQQYVSKLLTGRMADPAFEKACAIIDALGMTLDEFAAIQYGE